MPLNRFVDYGRWFQSQIAPDVDQRLVRHLGLSGSAFRLVLDDGDTLVARRVVVAAGIEPFARHPAVFAGLPPENVSHSSEERRLERLSRKSRRQGHAGIGAFFY